RTKGHLVGLENLIDDNEIKTKLQALL
ncbi:PTS ascorbate transporter subunit IIB, partial [Streptococcus suis]